MKPTFPQARKDPARSAAGRGRGARAARNSGVDNPGAGEAHPDGRPERDRKCVTRQKLGLQIKSGR